MLQQSQTYLTIFCPLLLLIFTLFKTYGIYKSPKGDEKRFTLRLNSRIYNIFFVFIVLFSLFLLLMPLFVILVKLSSTSLTMVCLVILMIVMTIYLNLMISNILERKNGN